MPVRIEQLVLCLAAMLAACVANAQTPQWPTPQDMERALKAHPFPDAGRIGAQAVPQPPRVNPLAGGVDIEALARGGMSLTPDGAARGQEPPALRIFITLEMPKDSLKLLTEQATRAGAQLVLRGLKAQSMRKTLAAAGELIGDRSVGWVIDPEAFTRFGVHKAPTFVLGLVDANPPQPPGTCGAGCAAMTPFVSIAGNVSLDYALEAMQRRRPEVAARIDPFIKRLRAPRS